MPYLRVVEQAPHLRVSESTTTVRVTPQVSGPQGPAGSPGLSGPQGPPGTTDIPDEWEFPPDFVVLFENALL